MSDVLTDVTPFKAPHEDHPVQPDHQDQAEEVCEGDADDGGQQAIDGVVDEEEVGDPLKDSPGKGLDVDVLRLGASVSSITALIDSLVCQCCEFSLAVFDEGNFGQSDLNDDNGQHPQSWDSKPLEREREREREISPTSSADFLAP